MELINDFITAITWQTIKDKGINTEINLQINVFI
jgi:hypothetical protein